jgi:hypothetical protein
MNGMIAAGVSVIVAYPMTKVNMMPIHVCKRGGRFEIKTALIMKKA